MTKLSQITPLGGNPQSTDYVVMTTSGNTTDSLVTVQEVTNAFNSTEDQTISGGANVTSLSLSTGNVTIDCGKRPLQYITNGGNFTITAPSLDGSCILLVTNNSSAGTITFSGFSEGVNIGDTLTTSNGNMFSIFIWCINGVSGYRIAAHQ